MEQVPSGIYEIGQLGENIASSNDEHEIYNAIH